MGHIYQLTAAHPDLDGILVPNLCSERPGAKNCSKYRDISGIALRSIAGTLGTVARRASEGERARLKKLLGAERYEIALAAAERLPTLLQPEIVSLSGRSCATSATGSQRHLEAPAGARCRSRSFPGAATVAGPDWRRVSEAFEAAYETVVHRAPNRVPDPARRDETTRRHRWAAYLHDDPLVTADLAVLP